MKKILIITYYWPPKGGVGVQRWLKLTKYLCKYNYKPIIYTPLNGVAPLQDHSLLKDVSSELTILKNKIFEPQKILSFFIKKKPSSDVLIKKTKSFLGFVLLWLRANLFVPDSRCLWIKPSIRFLTSYLKNNPVDIIISTGPPHSMHMIALALQKRNKQIKWIADFRDPWTDIEYFAHLPFLPVVKKRHAQLEKCVITNADVILSVSPNWAKKLNKMGAKKTVVLTNGYDPDDYQDNIAVKNKNLDKFIIGHFGLYNKLRDHDFFWKTLRSICDNNIGFFNTFKLLFSGEVHDTFFMQLENYQFDKKINYYPHLSHKNVIHHMMKCDILLVTQGETSSVLGRLPAKLFEYIGSKRPILAIGKKNSDLEKITSDLSYAWFVDIGNTELLSSTILDIYNMRASNYYYDDDISMFSRENQALKLMQLIENI